MKQNSAAQSGFFTPRVSPTAILCSIGLLLCHAGRTQAGTGPADSFFDPQSLTSCAWTSAAVYPIPIFENGVTTIGSTLYSFGGISNEALTASSYKFDGAVWTTIAPLPVALEKPAVVTDGTSVYIINGANTAGNSVNTLYRYNPTTNTYTTLAASSVATWSSAAVFLNGKIYKIAGYIINGASSADSNAVEIYNIANNTWSAAAHYPLSLGWLSAFTRGGFVYSAGGTVITGALSAKTYRYDPAANLWDDAAIADLPTGRWGAACANYDDGAVLAGGDTIHDDIYGETTSVIFWDGNAWSDLPDMLQGRVRTTGAVLNGNFHVVGGIMQGFFNGTTDNQKLTCQFTPTSVIAGAGATILSPGPKGVLDPGETVTVALSLQNVGNSGQCTTAGLTGTLQATGGVINPEPSSQNYGVTCAAGPVVTRNFTFTIDPALACGGTLTASLVITDGATNYGTLTYTFQTGTQVGDFSEKFDGVAAPALPAGWVATNDQGPAPLWVTSTTTPDTASNAAFIDDPAVISDKRLDTPGFVVTSPLARLSFRNKYNMEATSDALDGGVLEVSSPNINAGAFTDIIDPAVGGSFVSGGYNREIFGGFSGNPLEGRQAWSSDSGGYIDTVVNLGPHVVGQTIKLRFRMGSNNGTAGGGWWIDTISVTEPACAPTLLVTTVADHDDGVCDSADCTLREAINVANTRGGSIIGFASGMTGTIQLASALPALNKNIALQGPGANLLTVRRNAGGSYRIFNVPSTASVTLSGLTISNGSVVDDNGGGISNVGTLSLTGCAISGNNAGTTGAAGGSGGGIFNGSGAMLTLDRCTVSGNLVAQFGGGIYSDGILSVTNSTFSSDTAFLRGGAIISRFNNGLSSSTLRNCTIAGCSANSTSGGSGDGGGGYYAEGGAQQVHVSNTIIASNSNSINPDVRGNYTSDGHNFIGSIGNAAGFTNGVNGDQVGTNAARLNPQLGALANNGGPTFTRALLAGSPAIDAADPANFLATDQRGVLRPVDGNGDSDAVADIGAFEYLPPPVWRSVRTHAGAGPLPIVLNPTAAGNGLSGPSLESRQGGVQLVELAFPYPITLANPPAVTVVGRSTVGGVLQPPVNYAVTPALTSSTTLALTFPNPLPDATCYTISVAGALLGPAGVPLSGDLDCMARALYGDTTGSGDLNLSDAILIKSKFAALTSASSAPQLDLNLSGGNIDLADALAAKELVASPPSRALCP